MARAMVLSPIGSGALGHAFRRQVARELAVDVPFVQNARVERLALPDELAKHSRPRTCAGDDERVRIAVRASNFHAAEALVEGDHVERP